VKTFSLLLAFFVTSFSLHAQTQTDQSVKDSLKAELKELESYEEKLNIRITLLRKSDLHTDSIIAVVNNKMQVLDSSLLSKKKLLEEFENAPDKTKDVKKVIRILKKDCADLSERINSNKELLERIGKDSLETEDILAKAVRMVSEFRERISEIKKELQQ
jgi:chromosome segregation ATPase